MNYLAHLYLAESTDGGLLGGLLGDFVKGPIDPGVEPSVARGIRLHRQIDVFTDAHPLHLRSRRRFPPPRRRFAGIVVDLCYDHFLCARWNDFASEPITAFTQRMYAVLHASAGRLPDRLERIAPRMIAQDWLGSYAELDAVERALEGISRRLRRRNPLPDAIADVRASYDDLAADFDAFFPELVDHAVRLKDGMR